MATTPKQSLNSRITNGENLETLHKVVIIMVPFLLMLELWSLVDKITLGKFAQRIHFIHVLSLKPLIQYRQYSTVI